MEELSGELYDSIMDDLRKGDNLCKQEHFKTALVHYQKGLEKVPRQKMDWEISLHLYTALKDRKSISLCHVVPGCLFRVCRFM
jgi:hypothetical protein